MSEPTKTRATGTLQDEHPGPPRWAKAFGILFAVVVASIALLHLTGHAPGARLHGGASGRTGDESPQR